MAEALLQLLASLAVVATLAAVAYRLAPWRNRGGWITLAIAALALTIGIGLNLPGWTDAEGASLQYPKFDNFDMDYNYLVALSDAGIKEYDATFDGYNARAYRLNYPWIVSLPMRLFGPSVVPPLMLNALAVLMAMIVTGLLAARLLPERGWWNRPRISTAAMIAVASLAYWFTSGTLLMKEAMMQLAIPSVLLGLTLLYRPASTAGEGRWCLVMGVLGLALCTLLRSQFLVPLAIAALLMLRRRNVAAVLATASTILVIYYFYYTYVHLGTAPDGTTVLNEDYAESYFYQRPSQQPYLHWIADYIDWPLWRKLLWLPVSALVQFAIPLPWNWAADVHTALTLAYAHQGWCWYVVGCFSVVGLVMTWRADLRAGSFGLLSRMALAGVIAWMGFALLLAGTVSRYMLGFMPVYVSLAVYAASRLPWSAIWGRLCARWREC